MGLKIEKDDNFYLGQWFIIRAEPEWGYLHIDGVIRNSTFGNGTYSGRYKTREAARKVVRQYKEAQDNCRKGFIQYCNDNPRWTASGLDKDWAWKFWENGWKQAKNN